MFANSDFSELLNLFNRNNVKYLDDIRGMLEISDEQIDRHILTQWLAKKTLTRVWEAV